MKLIHMFALGAVCVVSTGAVHAWAQETAKCSREGLAKEKAQAKASGTERSRSGYLGLTPSVRASGDQSVYVLSVVEGGPAAESGLKPNDDIVEVNGREIADLDDLDRALEASEGANLKFTVRREGTRREVEVPVGSRGQTRAPASEGAVGELPPPAPSDQKPPRAKSNRRPDTATRRSGGDAAPLRQARPHLGIRVVDAGQLDAATRRRFDVSVRSGAVITGLTEGGPAARAGLPLGGVIVSIDGRRVGAAEDLVKLVKGFRPGQEIELTYWDGDRIGRKKLHLGPAPRGRRPAAGGPRTGAAASPPRADRPLLGALGRMLDDVLPPAVSDQSSAPVDRLPPPPPSSQPDPAGSAAAKTEKPVPPPPPQDTDDELPGIEINPPARRPSESDAATTPEEPEVETLRLQLREMQKQLDALRRRVEQLERKGSP